jgi:hypothetical protein
MSSEQERFLETLSRPWQDNAELHLLATQQLQAALDASGAKPEELVAATETLERADRNASRRTWWMRSFYLVAALVSLFAIGHLGLRYITFAQIRHELGWDASYFIGGSSFPLPGFLKHYQKDSPLTRHLSKQDALFIEGDRKVPSCDLSRWKTLWESEPDNPAYLVRYVAHASSLPDGFLETARRIDPDNGWFSWYASAFSGDIIDVSFRSAAERKAGKLDGYAIKNEPAFQQSLALIHIAASMPRFDNYSNMVYLRTISLLPVRSDLMGDFCRVYLFEYGHEATWIRLQYIGRIIDAEAQRCAKEHDVEGFRKLLTDWHWLMGTIPPNASKIRGLLYRAVLVSSVPHLLAAATTLDLPGEIRRLSAIEARASEYMAVWNEKKRHESEQDIIFRKYGGITSNYLASPVNYVLSPPKLTQSDLQPWRYASYALLMRGCSIPSLLIFWLFCGAFAIHRFRHGGLTRAISSRIVRLLRVSDWLWIAGLGIVFPLGYDFAITRLTSCGVRDQSWDNSWMMKQLSLQQAATLLLMILLSSLVARWRISARGSLVGISRRWDWFGLLCVVLTAVALPVFGMFSFPDLMGKFTIELDEKHDITPVVYLSPALVWLLIGAGRAVFGRARHALRRVTLARVLVPVWALAALVMALSEPVYYAEECHWVAKDKLFEITPDAYPTCYEHEVAKILRAEYFEILNGPGSTPHDTPLNEHE